MLEIKEVTVIGAGVMGARIAAHFCNAGISTNLIDIVSTKEGNRNALAEKAIKVMLKEEPAPFMSKNNAKLLKAGNIEDNIEWLNNCDWVIEAITERSEVKKSLYSKIAKYIGKDTIVSSNTSTIPIKDLTDKMDESIRNNFMITHFFNPPRYMRLLEIISLESTRRDLIDAIHSFCDIKLGKSVIHAKDTPGFIANRIGTYWFQLGIQQSLELNLNVEEADAIGSKPFGIPKSGFFGTLDLVGLDLMPHVAKSMLKRLPADDSYREIHSEPKIIKLMLEKGLIGRKGPGGFYRLKKSNGKRLKQRINLQTGEYESCEKINLESLKIFKKNNLPKLLEYDDKGGRFAWNIISKAIPYAASLVGEISEQIIDIDTAMREGYGWKYGPFEIADLIGVKWISEKLKKNGMSIPKILNTAAEKEGFYRIYEGKKQFLRTDGDYENIIRPNGVLLLSDIKLRSSPVLSNSSASVWDIGDRVLCFEFTSKMNSIDPDIMDLYKKVIKHIKNDNNFDALVIYNEGGNFSVGANIGLFLFAANIAMWNAIETQISDGQRTYMSIKRAPFPVIAAPSGMALGGGCEILMHCDAVQAHAETYTGLVEAGVGIIPGWGGCKELIIRLLNSKHLPGGPIPAIAKAFEIIGTAQVAKSAFEAKEFGFLRDEDGITMNKDRLLSEAKSKAISLRENYKQPAEQKLSLPGPTGLSTLKLALHDLTQKGMATSHDKTVAISLAKVLTGEKTDITEELNESDILDLEVKHFMTLAKNEKSLARMEHMLNTGKPLRN